MRVPNSLQSRRVPSDPEAATAFAVALLTDPTGPNAITDIWRLLERRNVEMLTAPKQAIRESLARQTVLLEATLLRYTTHAAGETNPTRAELLNRIAIRCHRSLLATLGALNSMAGEQDNANTPETAHELANA